jgi:hypothetical protein
MGLNENRNFLSTAKLCVHNRLLFPSHEIFKKPSRDFCLVRVREKVHWGDPGVDGRIILRRIFRKWDVGVWTGSSWPRIGTGGRHL